MKPTGLILACILLLSACDKPQANSSPEHLPRPAKIAIARTMDEQKTRIFPGVTEATRKTDLAFRVGGQVVAIPVLAGQAIKQGDLIARLDDAPYRATLADRKARYDLAQVNYTRQKTLFEKKQVAKSRLDEAVSSFEAAQAALTLAQDDLTHTRLTAPYDGLISRIDIDAFQNVQAQQPVAQIQGMATIDVIFNVPENLFVLLKKENAGIGNVQIRLDSMPDKIFDARYREHETTPDVTTRSYKVNVSMPRPEGITLLPGMSASVIVDLSSLYRDQGHSVLVPMESVFDEGGKTFVWHLDESNIATKAPVVVEGLEGTSIRIRDGLAPGDRVIAVGAAQIHEGQRVRPLVRERGI
ncbi:MAG TPA: efflux RND transporter periplasmic adaptor subunit [Rhodospirillaceae bacterium]|nr:MAG: hypothetical protein A2018_06690 [Alphaproteobacteria bacterium GWF2_58_20]HAU29870.1 efflux RND transporter periplasmic adaptor subunit [Rhodospirillaceae bacterium]